MYGIVKIFRYIYIERERDIFVDEIQSVAP